ncbi:DUF3040 domain-containing protein [Aeromicrobium sp. CF3.5]|uniref:DUF3040 domain-containing protein n=1 Tax=Aeromicrobium sp. CF3.5 TaxID=3373078 RepID=UPI003EE5D835
MPLSDEEARMLQQLEQSLAAEDPEFASTLRGSKLLAHNRRVAVLAGLGFLVGLGVMFAGAVLAYTWLGIIGFVGMLAAGYVFALAWKSGIGGADQAETSSGRSPGPAKAKQAKSGGSFVNRMEERWQRRQDGDDR